MIKRAWSTKIKETGRYLPYLFFSVVLLLLSIPSFSLYSSQHLLIPVSTDSTVIISKSFLSLILIISFILILICSFLIFYSIRNKKGYGELEEKNKQILDINLSLRNKNNELAIQKELITKEHSESDKFYEMLVQSANDGISFYDRDWNLKYANSAFYSIIGLDRDSYNSINPDDLIHPEDKDYQIKKDEKLLSEWIF